MSDNAELIKKLKNAKEDIHVLRSLIKRGTWIQEQGEELADRAESGLTGALYDLTGDDFYLKN